MPIKLELGDSVRDRITGYSGIVVAKTHWLNGCVRITLQSQKIKDDYTPVESQTFDEPQLELIQAGAFEKTNPDTGGPAPTPKQHATISRG